MRRAPDPIRRAIRWGLDVTLLTSSLEHPPAERLVRAVNNAASVQIIRRAPPIDLLGIIEALANDGVRVVLVGGLAASVHGSAHVTWDLDLCYDSAPENVERMVRVLERWNPVPRENPDADTWRLDAASLASAPVTRLRTTIGEVDLFREMIGVGDYAACRAKAERVCLEEFEVWVLYLNALISAKRLSPRCPERGPLFSLKALRALKERERATATAEGPTLADRPFASPSADVIAYRTSPPSITSIWAVEAGRSRWRRAATVSAWRITRRMFSPRTLRTSASL